MKEYSCELQKRTINKYCKKNNYKERITQEELIELFNKTFTETFEDCMGYYGDVVETMDETMDKNGYDFHMDCLTYIRRTPYKKRPRNVKGQEKFDI